MTHNPPRTVNIPIHTDIVVASFDEHVEGPDGNYIVRRRNLQIEYQVLVKKQYLENWILSIAVSEARKQRTRGPFTIVVNKVEDL